MIDLRFKMRGLADPDMILQARGYVAALHALFGDAVLPGSRKVGKAPELAMGYEAPTNITNIVSNGGGAGGIEPTETDRREPDASSVFADPGTSMSDGAIDASAVFAAPSPPSNPIPDTTAGDLDKDGIRWDERIHASTKTTTAGGTWTRRRNTDDALFNSVMAELRAEKAARSGAAPAPAAPEPAREVVIPPPPAEAPATGEITFLTVMRKVTGMQAAKTLTPADVATILAGLGSATATIVALTQNKALIPPFDVAIDMIAAGLPVADAVVQARAAFPTP